jgi:hypothetical protein
MMYTLPAASTSGKSVTVALQVVASLVLLLLVLLLFFLLLLLLLLPLLPATASLDIAMRTRRNPPLKGSLPW